MNQQLAKAINIIPVHAVTAKSVVARMEMFMNREGEQTAKLSDVFSAGCLCADYTAAEVSAAQFTEKLQGNEPAYYGRFNSTMFIDDEGNPVPPCSTIYMVDPLNFRKLYIVVAFPGLNIVYYETKPNGAQDYTVDLVSNIENAKLANHMEPEWKEFCLHDLVTAAQMFGFEYDKDDDEVRIPPGRPANSFVLARNAGAATMEMVRTMMGGGR
ncbi:hypothetical protein [Burkholderia phage FLC6]|nr:hypothetical protein [Burkholderia phage FLC6]